NGRPGPALERAHGIGLQNAALHHVEGARPRPGHALQEPTAIDAVVVVVVQDHVVCAVASRVPHRVLLGGLVAPRSVSIRPSRPQDGPLYSRVPGREIKPRAWE